MGYLQELIDLNCENRHLSDEDEDDMYKDQEAGKDQDQIDSSNQKRELKPWEDASKLRIINICVDPS